MLFTYLGITSFFSRHLFCKMGDFRYFNRFHFYQEGMTFSGLCVLCLPLANSFGSIVAILLVNGLMDGAMQGQFSLLVLGCVGKRKVIHAWGFIMFFVGLTSAIGPPLAGKLKLIVLTFRSSCTCCGLIFFGLKCFQTKHKRIYVTTNIKKFLCNSKNT